jgi:hypothetical protein
MNTSYIYVDLEDAPVWYIVPDYDPADYLEDGRPECRCVLPEQSCAACRRAAADAAGDDPIDDMGWRWQDGNPGDNGEPINYFLVTTLRCHGRVLATVDQELDGKWRVILPKPYDPETDSDARWIGAFDTAAEAKAAARAEATGLTF